MTALKETYKTKMVPKLQRELGFTNMHQVPRIEKVVVNMGFGVKDKNLIAAHVEELRKITGQKPAMRKSTKSIANFKLREGMTVGAKVTLRGPRMYDFLERLINSCLPRIRDFRGVPGNSFDSQGNYTLGIKDQSIFPELDPNDITATQGMDITIVTTTHDKKATRKLLLEMGMPFADKDKDKVGGAFSG